MCCGNKAGSYLRLIDSCITHLDAQGPSRTCSESKEEEEVEYRSLSLAGMTHGVLEIVASLPSLKLLSAAGLRASGRERVVGRELEM